MVANLKCEKGEKKKAHYEPTHQGPHSLPLFPESRK